MAQREEAEREADLATIDTGSDTNGTNEEAVGKSDNRKSKELSQKIKNLRKAKIVTKSAFTKSVNLLRRTCDSDEANALRKAWGIVEEAHDKVVEVTMELYECFDVLDDDKKMESLEQVVDAMNETYSSISGLASQKLKQIRGQDQNPKEKETRVSGSPTPPEIQQPPSPAREQTSSCQSSETNTDPALPTEPQMRTGQLNEAAKQQDEPTIGKDLWLQLRRIGIPVFSGCKKDYAGWKATFTACVNNAPATKEYKLLQLRQYLSGEALKAVADLGHSAAAYDAALERLERKFGGKRRQIELQFQSLTEFKPVRPNSPRDLEQFADLLDVATVNIKEFGLEAELQSRLFYSLLLKKLPERMVADFTRWLEEKRLDKTIENLRQWVIKESEIRVAAYEAVRGVDHSPAEDARQKPARQTTFLTTSQQGSFDRRKRSSSTSRNSLKCKFCSADHPVWFCAKFKQLSQDERWAAVNRLKLCTQCLSDAHDCNSCNRLGYCGINGCAGMHNRLLHKEKDHPKSESEDADEELTFTTIVQPTINACLSGCSEKKALQTNKTAQESAAKETDAPKIALRTVPVILSNGRKRLRVNALLDDASTSTFVSTSVAAELGLQGLVEKSSVGVLNGQVATIKTTTVEFDLENVTKTLQMSIAAKAIDNVAGNLRAVDWQQEAENWPHLKRMQFPAVSRPLKVDLLIGLDYAMLHQSLGDVCGKTGIQPIARLTPLGWTCIGRTRNRDINCRQAARCLLNREAVHPAAADNTEPSIIRRVRKRKRLKRCRLKQWLPTLNSSSKRRRNDRGVKNGRRRPGCRSCHDQKSMPPRQSHRNLPRSKRPGTSREGASGRQTTQSTSLQTLHPSIKW